MTGSDWAGDINNRRSTSGGLLLLGDHLLQHWSKLQATISLSSGEAELNSSVKGVSECIGIYELWKEWHAGMDIGIQLNIDSSDAKGTLSRRGSGKIKHLTTKQLWVQEAIRNYTVELVKIRRDINCSDLLTHQCSRPDFDNHLGRLQIIRM